MAIPTLPPTMRAWTFNSRGPPRSVLSFNHAFPTPPPPAGSDLLIRISHTALNPGSLALLQLGILPLLRRSSIAANIAEYEFAGTVYLAGPAAPERFKERGTRVFGTVPIQSWETLRSGVGAAAEFMVVKADVLAVMPEGMEMQEAAGLSANGQTALKMCETAGIKPEMKERVLVNGASGGVGTMACQIAKAMGAQEVVGICSGGNAEMVKGLGVDEVSLIDIKC